MWGLRLAQEIPGEGLRVSPAPVTFPWTCIPPAISHCSLFSGKGFCNCRHRRPGPGLVHPILLSPCVPHGTDPIPTLLLGVRVQPQSQGGDLQHLYHGGHILKPTHPSLGVTHPYHEPRRGRDSDRKGVELWVEMMGEESGCTSLG